jgi:hypothetical protein
MAGLRPLALAAAFLIASCREASPAAGCGALANCLATPHGIILGRDPAARAVAANELRFAAGAYRGWLGEEAPPGLLILDTRAKKDSGRVGGTAWTMTYDLVGDSAMAGPVPASDASTAQGGADSDEPLAVSRANSDFDITRRGVLAHEICHKYASFAFNRIWSGQRRLPDMLDEVAAISCETNVSRSQRVRLFASRFAKGQAIPWRGFLATAHPLKGDAAVSKVLESLGTDGKNTVTFDIRPGSRYEGQIALFYSQAAAFGGFLETGACKGKAAIGRLLTTYDPEAGFDSWLKANGREFCLPSSSAEFGRLFGQHLAKQGGLRAEAKAGAP